MRGFLQRLQSSKKRLAFIVLLMLVACAVASGQSSDANFPTPVLSDAVSGSITPRDIGDARLTRHFYTFNGVEGDLLITVESTNLNGDVDLFTAVTLRPLAKVTLYAGSSPTRATKSVYLRRSETLMIRIEGRTALDTDATYSIRFAGAFAPAANVAPPPEVVAVPSLSSEGGDRNARRASSVGARVDEPRTEPVTETTSTETDPAAATTPPETPATTPSENGATSAEAAASAKPTPRRRVRVRPSRTARARTPDATGGETAGGSSSETSGETSATANPSDAPARAPTPRRRNARSRAATARRNDPAAGNASDSSAPPPAASARLIIENRDGTRIERDMNTVRRVTVENGVIVIISRDGKTDRQPMVDVLRMSIEPQLQTSP